VAEAVLLYKPIAILLLQNNSDSTIHKYTHLQTHTHWSLSRSTGVSQANMKHHKITYKTVLCFAPVYYTLCAWYSQLASIALHIT